MENAQKQTLTSQPTLMSNDPSNGYEAAAHEFIKHRSSSDVGAKAVRSWARTLVPGATVLDLGCGHGIPVTEAMAEEGCQPYGIDASPTLIASYKDHFPHLPAACEPVETSRFFGKPFDGAVAWGLLFLLSEEVQDALIHRISAVLNPGGQFMFTSPRQACTWTDILTDTKSQSLGAETYGRILSEAGLSLTDTFTDEGENHYYIASKE